MIQLAPDPLSCWPKFESQAEYHQFKAQHQACLDQAWLRGQQAAANASTTGKFSGFCSVCETQGQFDAKAQPSDGVNLRESLVCDQCLLNARMRAVHALLRARCPRQAECRIYLTEQRSWFYQRVRQQWPCVLGSEYYGVAGRPGWLASLRHFMTRGEPLRHQDITALTLESHSVDALVTCDVLEHVPNYRQAVAEMARVLRADGWLILTVPFRSEHADTQVRAQIDADGQIAHLMTPEYHGDPLDPQGVLAFYDFGWDLLDVVREAGFARAAWCLPWAPDEGLFWGLWALVARR